MGLFGTAKPKEEFSHLKSQTHKVQGLAKGEKPSLDEVIDYFLRNGLDGKGQAQNAYTANGGGLSANVSFNPAIVIGLNCEVGVSANATRLTETMVIAHRGPDALEGGPIASPVMLNCMTGVVWEGGAGASLEIGVKAEASFGYTEKGSKGEAKTSFDEDDGGGDDDEGKLEAFGASCEAKAGFEANLSVNGTHMYLEDPLPLHFPASETTGSRFGDLRGILGAIFEEGSVKLAFQKVVADFVNLNKEWFGGGISRTKWLGLRDTQTSDYIEKLEAGAKLLGERRKKQRTEVVKLNQKHFGPKAVAPRDPPLSKKDQELLDEAQNLVSLLRTWTDKTPQDRAAFLKIWSMGGGADAGIKASASAQAQALKVAKVGAEAELALAAAAWKGKMATLRYQVPLERFDEGDPVLLCTQDTRILYSQVSFEAGKLSMSGKASVRTVSKVDPGEGLLGSRYKMGKKEVGTEGFGKVGKALSEGVALWEKELNRMSYVSSIVYWRRPALRGTTGSSTHQIAALPGSGVAFGQSVVLGNLVKLVRAVETAQKGGSGWEERAFSASGVRALAAAMARTLHVPLPTLARFLASSAWVTDALVDTFVAIKRMNKAKGSGRQGDYLHALGEDEEESALEKSVLLESTFRMPSPLPLDVTRKSVTVGGGFFSSGTRYDVAVLDPNARTCMLAHANIVNPGVAVRTLQSLRIRYRMADATESESSFTLGFKLCGNGAGIKLSKIERAGSEGIVDYHTVFFRNGEVHDAVDQIRIYNAPETVPAAMLFCQ